MSDNTRIAHKDQMMNHTPLPERLAALESAAGEAGDTLQSALCCKALGISYARHDLDADDRARVDAMTVHAARAACVRVLADQDAQE